MLNRQIEKMLTEKLGQPNRAVKKVSAWALNSNADVVLETNYETTNSGSLANLWLPAIHTNKCSQLNVVQYPEGKGRHSNTYASKGLEKDKAAIRVKLTSMAEAESLLSALFNGVRNNLVGPKIFFGLYLPV
jgi:hypothetical protein